MKSKTPRKLIDQAQQTLHALPPGTLPARELEILKRRATGATFKEIAAEMDLTFERITQLHSHMMLRARILVRDSPAEVYIFERFG